MNRTFVIIVISILVNSVCLAINNKSVFATGMPLQLQSMSMNQSLEDRPTSSENMISDTFLFLICKTGVHDSNGDIIESEIRTHSPKLGYFFQVEMSFLPNDTFPIRIHINEIDLNGDIVHTEPLLKINEDVVAYAEYSTDETVIYSEKYIIIFETSGCSIIIYELNDLSYNNSKVRYFEADYQPLFMKNYNSMKKNLKKYGAFLDFD